MNEEDLELIENQELEANTEQTAPAAEHTVTETVPDGSADLGVDENTAGSHGESADLGDALTESAGASYTNARDAPVFSITSSCTFPGFSRLFSSVAFPAR